MHKIWPLLGLTAACSSSTPAPSSLQAPLERRLRGDRTGACVSLALIADGSSERSTVCAGEARELDGSAFEIGSITKSMTGFAVASLIAEGKLALTDSLEAHLPPGTVVPRFEGTPITIAHLLAHSSGLPSLPAGFMPANPNDPYADVTEALLLGALAEVKLSAPPGTTWSYSNYGYMLLSSIVSARAGKDFEALLAERLFGPLGMRAFIRQRPDGVMDVQGHLPLGIAVPPWTFPAQFAGVGGVHATLDDMIRYAEAMLGSGDAATVAMLARTTEVVRSAAEGPAMGMGWIHQQVGTHALLLHDGGTGGFSSLIAIEKAAGRAVVALSDTALSNTGGLTELAMHVLLPDVVPLDLPRKVATPSAALLEELAGTYLLDTLAVTLSTRDGKLFLQAAGQPELELGFDSYGDFYPATLIDAVLTPVRTDGAPTTFEWKQGGGMVRAVRAP